MPTDEVYVPTCPRCGDPVTSGCYPDAGICGVEDDPEPDHSPGAARVLPGVTCSIPGHCAAENPPAPVTVGQQLWLDGDPWPWTVRSTTARYAALTRVEAGETWYTVLDWQTGIRGACNLPGHGYGDGTYTEQQCAELLALFEDGYTEISLRNLRAINVTAGAGSPTPEEAPARNSLTDRIAQAIGDPGSPPDDYNDAIQELGELISELPDRLGLKIAMAFSKGLVAAYCLGRQEAIDEARTATASQPSGGDSHA